MVGRGVLGSGWVGVVRPQASPCNCILYFLVVFVKAQAFGDALLDAEVRALKDPHIRDLLNSLPLVDWVYVRETILGLACFDYKWVTPPAFQTATTQFTGLANSEINEQSFNNVKDHKRDVKNKRISRHRTLYIPAAEKIITTLFKRPEVVRAAHHSMAYTVWQLANIVIYDVSELPVAIREL
jgi:hypothetical protein